MRVTRNEAQVVHIGEAAGILRAAAERGFEFPAEALAVRVAQQELRKRPRVRGDVENFILADAGKWAGGDIAHGVAAGFARGDSRRGQPAHDASAYRQYGRNEAARPGAW